MGSYYNKTCGCNSGFAAIANEAQRITNIPTKVTIYGQEEFDINNEYNPATSTFIPQQSGLYSTAASLIFTPDNPNTPYIAGIIVRVNGVNKLYDQGNTTGLSTLDVSGILQLQAGDRVEVFAAMTTPGVLCPISTSRFQSVRIG